MLCQLSYWPNTDPGDFVPPDPLTRSLAGTHEPRSVRVAHFAFARALSISRSEKPRVGLSPQLRTSNFILRAFYLLSLCAVCFRQKRQYLFSSSRSELLRRFFVVL